MITLHPPWVHNELFAAERLFSFETDRMQDEQNARVVGLQSVFYFIVGEHYRTPVCGGALNLDVNFLVSLFAQQIVRTLC